MNIKMILPMMMLAAMPLGADAQNKSGLVMENLDKTVSPANDFYKFATGGRRTTHSQQLTAATAASICWQMTITSVSIPFFLNFRRRLIRRVLSSRNCLTSISWLLM